MWCFLISKWTKTCTNLWLMLKGCSVSVCVWTLVTDVCLCYTGRSESEWRNGGDDPSVIDPSFEALWILPAAGNQLLPAAASCQIPVLTKFDVTAFPTHQILCVGFKWCLSASYVRRSSWYKMVPKTQTSSSWKKLGFQNSVNLRLHPHVHEDFLKTGIFLFCL